MWAAAWDRGEVEALEALVTPDYLRVGKASGKTLSLQQLQAEILGIREAFPDLATIVDAVVVDGDKAAIFWTSTGTHTAPFMGVPPTGRRVQTRGSNFVTLDGGRIKQETVTWDSSELLNSLGIRHLGDALAEPGTGVVVDSLSGEPDLEIMKTFNRQFVTGVTVVTTQEGGVPKGLAVNAYASVSLEPPLVMVCIQKTSSTYPALFASSHLGINILSNQQKSTVATFASKSADKFAEIDWHAGPSGSPLIDGSSAALEAEIRERFQAKTHTIFICRVRHAEVSEASPMVYQAGRFFDSEGLSQL
ncbi:flavin reductase domain-containing protein [Arthrobacter crystallopoietes BAB-32]|uniref:Flavin reductase domain-containing protein n=1 Tax=Arthrobacter crystallopoietes BAB-32 TaxID=1246476 RepID=N1UZA0_9MICC|nr:flavin reductase domain-containing protein [Arthrobacter crystallopoietes BAB-32]